MKLGRSDGGEMLPLQVEKIVRQMTKAIKSVSIDVARSEGRRGDITAAKQGFSFRMKPHVYNTPMPKQDTEVEIPKGSRWRREDRDVKVLASGSIGEVCLTAKMLACEAMAIWPTGWPELRIVVYQDGKSNAWAYAATFVENYTRVTS
jgi:hypothetical protein